MTEPPPGLHAVLAGLNPSHLRVAGRPPLPVRLLPPDVQECEAGQPWQQGGALLGGAAVQQPAAVKGLVGHGGDGGVAPARAKKRTGK